MALRSASGDRRMSFLTLMASVTRQAHSLARSCAVFWPILG
jgi:hypothetical protein